MKSRGRAENGRGEAIVLIRPRAERSHVLIIRNDKHLERPKWRRCERGSTVKDSQGAKKREI